MKTVLLDGEAVFLYGENLKNARKKAKLTQIEAAEQIGIAVNSLRLYEGDHRVPQVSVMCRMADVYGVTLDNLIGGDEFAVQNRPKVRILNALDKLNAVGKEKAVERIEELTEIEKYLLPAFKKSSTNE